MGAAGESTLARLQAGPTARPTYQLIQVLRAVAALMVVVHHGTIMLQDREGVGSNWVNGGAGVDIFFVISGLVMTLSSAPLLTQRHAARTFLARRLERIAPMYWLATTAKIAIVVLAPALAVNALGSARHVLSSYLFLPSHGPGGTVEPVLVVGWTLNFEMLFYAVFAGALALRAPLLRAILPALLVLSTLWCLPASWHVPWPLRWYGRPIVLEFLFGVGLALGIERARRLPWAAAVALVVGGLSLLMMWPAPNFSVWRGLGWGLPALAVVWGAVALEKKLGAAVPRWLLELGDASYSIYLVHGLVLPLIGTLLTRSGLGHAARGQSIELTVLGWTLLMASTAISTGCGEGIYRLIEKPMTEALKGRRKTAVPANG